jgi:hypothetical protein
VIDLRDRRRLVVELLLAELLARPGRPGPLARPRWARRVVVAPPPAAGVKTPGGGRREQGGPR